MRLFEVCVVAAVLAASGLAVAEPRGVVSIVVRDASKKGVPGVVVSANVGGTELRATTGAEQPGDAELGAAMKQGSKVADALVSDFNARATLDAVPIGDAVITLSNVKGAKPLKATITADRPTWKLTATVDGKTKKLVGAATLEFDELAYAKLQIALAKEEQARAKAAADAANAARADKDRTDAELKRAKEEAEAERLKRVRMEARSKVSASATFCQCKPEKKILVHCSVKNTAEVAVRVGLDVFAESGTFGANAEGKTTVANLPAGGSTDLDVLVPLGVNIGCNSCKHERCSISSVVPF